MYVVNTLKALDAKGNAVRGNKIIASRMIPLIDHLSRIAGMSPTKIFLEHYYPAWLTANGQLFTSAGPKNHLYRHSTEQYLYTVLYS